MPRGSTFNKKVYFVQEFPIVHSTSSLMLQSMIYDMFAMLYSFLISKKITCEHLRNADCTTGMKVNKNCFHCCENKEIINLQLGK